MGGVAPDSKELGGGLKGAVGIIMPAVSLGTKLSAPSRHQQGMYSR